jgi:hypothetical protein
MLSATAPRSTREHVQRLKEFAARRKDTAGAPTAKQRPKEPKMKKTLQTISKAEVQAITAFFREHPTANQKRYADKQNIDLRTLRSILRDDARNRPAPVAEPEPEPEEAPADPPESWHDYITTEAEAAAPFDGEHRVTPAPDPLPDDLLIAIDQLPADHPDQERHEELHADVAATLATMHPGHPDYDHWRRGTRPGEAPDLPAFWEETTAAPNGAIGGVRAQTGAPILLEALATLVQSGRVTGRVSINLDLAIDFGGNDAP